MPNAPCNSHPIPPFCTYRTSGQRPYNLSDVTVEFPSIVHRDSGNEITAGFDNFLYFWQAGVVEGKLLHFSITDEDYILAQLRSLDER